MSPSVIQNQFHILKKVLRELQCAASFNSKHLNQHFENQELWQMVTKNAAQALGLSEQIGQIKQGYWADLAVIAPSSVGAPFSNLVSSDSQDIVLTIRGGTPLYGDQAVINYLVGSACESMSDVCGVPKAICLAETGFTYKELEAANRESYQLAICSATELEPSCSPSRYNEYSGEIQSSDRDGDGLSNNVDNCPNIFNPSRPIDNGVQMLVCAAE